MALTKVTQHSLGNSAVTTAKLGTAPFGFANSSANVVYMAANGNIGIGNSTPLAPLSLYRATNTDSTATGSTLLSLTNYVGGDLSRQKTFIDFAFLDDNSKEYPQVRIGAEIGQNNESDSQIKEGSGAFVVYTNNATTDGSANSSPSGMTEKLRVDYLGNVGIGNSAPGHLLSVNGSAYIKNGVGGVPIFYARQASSQTLGNGTNAKITYDTVVYDTNSFFTGGSTSRFQPTIAGYYWLNANYRSGAAGAATCDMSFYVSGSAYISSHINQQGTNDQGGFITAIVYLNGSQYVEVWANQNGGGSTTTSNGDNLGNSNVQTWWQGMLIRAA